MKGLVTFAVLLCIANAAFAVDTGNRRPANAPEPIQWTEPIQSSSSAPRQGGDTFEDATLISLPYSGTGTTTGYTDDYNLDCNFLWGYNPEVVYTFVPQTTESWDIDLFGSSTGEMVFLFDVDQNFIDCHAFGNQDWTALWTDVTLDAGVTYFLVIKGYTYSEGEYQLEIRPHVPCAIDIPAGALPEGEPPLVDFYDDSYNGGCNSPAHGYPMQRLVPSTFHGISGWFQGDTEYYYRDTDYFTLTIPDSGSLTVWGDADYLTYMGEIAPLDCPTSVVVQPLLMGPCRTGEITFTGTPGAEVWLWVAPQEFLDVTVEYNYVLWVGTEPNPTDIFSDGFESGDTSAWTPMVP